MNEDIRNFIKILEKNESQYEASINEIRSTFKNKIPKEDVVTPQIILNLQKEKKKLDKRWGIEGKLIVDKALGLNEDADASLHYSTGDLNCGIYAQFKNGNSRINKHRAFKDLLPNLDIQARIIHPYYEGDELWAKLSEDRTHWEILYRNNSTGKSSVKARTKNFCNLKTLEKTLKNLEKEWNVLSKGHRAIW